MGKQTQKDKDIDKELLLISRKENNESEQAKVEMIEKYTPMIWHVASTLAFYREGNNEDLLQAGILGIMRAIETYDEEKNSSVKTWMYYNIRKALQQCKNSEFTVRTTQYHRDRGGVASSYEYIDEVLYEKAEPIDPYILEDNIHLTSDILIYLNRKFPAKYAEIFYKYYFEAATIKELDKEYNLISKMVIYQVKVAIRKKFFKKGKKNGRK